MSQTPHATDTATDGGPVAKEAAKGAPTAAGPAAPEAIPPQELALRVEALLMVTDRPLALPRMAELLPPANAKAVAAAVEALNRVYDETGRSFRIEALAGGYQILTLPRFAPVLEALQKSREETRLRPAALETLAIIAYKQPVLRADVEAVRGVACGEVIRSLMERHLVKIVGRAEVLGRPMLYGTTRTFLEVFGLASLKDLPRAEELRPKGA